MGLSTPLSLLLAAFIALPVIAHFIRRADVKRRVLPTVALLSRISVQDRNRARVTEPWLLALRVLAIALVVLAAAAPFFTRPSAYGDGSSVALAVVIDDSLSMGQHTSNATAFEEARERAREVVLSLGEGSEVALLGGGSPARILVPRTTNRSVVLAALDALELGARSTDLRAAVQLASRQLGSARFATRRTLVLSDFAGQDEHAFDDISGEIDLEALVTEAAPNASIVDVRVTRDPLDTGSQVAVVDVQSTGEEASLTVHARLLDVANTDDLARSVITLEAHHGRATLRFRSPANAPFISFALEQQDDALPDDDTRIVSLAQPTPTQVVLVEPTGSGLARHAARALGVAPQEDALLVRTMDADRLDGRSGVIDPAHAQEAALSHADIVILLGVIPTNAGALAALTRFTEAGGALVFAPSATAHVRDLPTLAEYFPGITMGALETRDVAVASPVTQTNVAEATNLLPPGPTGLESLHTRLRLALHGEPSSELLHFDDGAPFAVVQREERRAVLSVGLDPSMSDLPLRVGFVPLLLSLAHALERAGTLPHRPFHGGEVPAVNVTGETTSAEVTSPSGALVSVEANEGTLDLSRFVEPGGYRIAIGDSAPSTFVIVPPATESNLVPVMPTERASSATREASEARTPMAPLFFVLVGFLTLIEGFARFAKPRVARA